MLLNLEHPFVPVPFQPTSPILLRESHIPLPLAMLDLYLTGHRHSKDRPSFDRNSRPRLTRNGFSEPPATLLPDAAPAHILTTARLLIHTPTPKLAHTAPTGVRVQSA